MMVVVAAGLGHQLAGGPGSMMMVVVVAGWGHYREEAG